MSKPDCFLGKQVIFRQKVKILKVEFYSISYEFTQFIIPLIEVLMVMIKSSPFLKQPIRSKKMIKGQMVSPIFYKC